MFFSKNRFLLISVAVVLAIDGGTAYGAGANSLAMATGELNVAAQQQFVNNTIANNKIVIFSKTFCLNSSKVKKYFDALSKPYVAIELNQIDYTDKYLEVLKILTGGRSVPKVFINGKYVGDFNQVTMLFQQKKLEALINSEN